MICFSFPKEIDPWIHWVTAPEEMTDIVLEKLSRGEEKRYSAEMIP
jgi:hypothetical protein